MSASTHPFPAPLPPGKPSPVPVPVPAPVQPKRRRRWMVPLLLAGLGLLGGALYLLLKPGQVAKTGSADLVRTAKVTSGPIERVIRVAGQTSARNFVSIMVPVFRGPDSGRELTLTKVAQPGSFVRKGELVAALDAQTLRDHIDDAEDTVEQAENDILKKNAEQEVEWETLQQSLRIAKADRDKAKLELSAAEVKTEIERELLKLSYDEAEAAYKQLAGDVSRTKISNDAEIRILEITAQRQRIHRDNHKRDLEKFTMNAPMDGLVVMSQLYRGGQMTQVREGDLVHPGQPFMKIVDLNSMQMEAIVSQADCNEFRVGQTATIGLDAFPGLQFKGAIYSIGALAVKGLWDTYYVRNIPVRITIQGSDPRLIPDLSAWAHIHFERQENATLVPAAAVQLGGGEDAVWVKRGSRFQKQPVQFGLRTTTQVAVLSGLRAGEEVAVQPVR